MSETNDNEDHTSYDLGQALLLEWPFWLVAVAGLLTTGYFYTTERLLRDYTAETFYAVLFGLLTVAVAGYGVVRTRDRMRKYDF